MSFLPELPSPNVSQEPLYNIGVVTRMTGISMARLRAWERRYNFPEASRTAGGHRLYSERDILQLRWVKSRIDEGMQTAQAIQALRHQESAGNSINLTTLDKSVVEETPGSGVTAFEIFHDRLSQALIERNLHRADQVLAESLVVASPEDIILKVIAPSFRSIGDAWEEGSISVATEHLATNYLRQRLLMWMVSGPPPQSVQPVVLACGPDEWHEGSLLILGALLTRQCWPVAYLGQAVPLPDLAFFVKDLHPLAVVVVAMTENSASALLEWPRWMPEAAASGKPMICFGGRFFNTHPDWQSRVPGVYLGSSLEQGFKNLSKLLAGLSS